VRYAPRLPDLAARTGDELVVSHADADLPLEHTHRFVLVAMDVERAAIPLLEKRPSRTPRGGRAARRLAAERCSRTDCGVAPPRPPGTCRPHRA